ncbi:MAG: hypothetical protein ACXAEN_24220 [Candidatus Thorarchaeota archaeon]
MSKEEMITTLEKWEGTLGELTVFLTQLTQEDVVKNMYAHSVGGFLITAVDYLQTNLSEMRHRVEMS